jgi:predicted aminopeptidase
LRVGTADTLKAQLLRARRIRDFASKELGCPTTPRTEAMRTSAAAMWCGTSWPRPEFSVEPRTWCFPIAGCVSYRGYFSERAANASGTRRSAGDDVIVGGVPAYSTLGRIADPLLNTVTGYAELDLAALIFHELAHRWRTGRVNPRGTRPATAVEEAGVARYAAQLGDAALLARWQQRRRMRVALSASSTVPARELARIYQRRLAPGLRGQAAAPGGNLPPRSASWRRSRDELGFGSWIEAGLNNAHLASVATYYERVPHFEDLLKNRCGDYLPCLYVLAKQEQTK